MTFDYSIEIKRSFRYALIFSVIFHALIVANWPFYGRLFSVKDQFKDIEITYIRVKEPPAAAPRKSEDVIKKSQPQLESAQPVRIVSEELPKAGQAKKSDTAAPKRDIGEIKKDEAKIVKKPVAEQRAAVAINQPVIPKTETATSVDLKDLRLVPPSYAQMVRSRIIDNLDSEGSEGEGDVFLRFVITSRGEVKDISIIGEKSVKNPSLRKAAFEAVRNSSPFPKFSEHIVMPEITFTCQISFLRK